MVAVIKKALAKLLQAAKFVVTEVVIIERYIERRAQFLKRHKLKTIFVMLSVFLWSFVITLHSRIPVQYESEWTLILPGSGDGHAVSLDSIGQASASKPSPYGGSSSLNPSANYKAIATSLPVLRTAADELDMSISEMGVPKIKLVDQTSLIAFTISGLSPELAQLKGRALYKALQKQLNLLRDDEQLKVNNELIATLDNFGNKLRAAQKNKLAYQIDVDVLSVAQFEQLIVSLEQERIDLQQRAVEAAALEQQQAVLLQAIGLDATKIYQAVNLRNDQLFQELIKRHADLHAQLATVAGTWGENHPKRQRLETAHHEVEHDLLQRGHKLTHNPTLSVWALIEMGSNQFENTLFTQFIDQQSQLANIQKEVQGRTLALQQLEQRINQQMPKAAELEDLIRKEQVATAVFSTALAKQDIGKADRFSSYPLVQLLTAPTLPLSPKKLKHTLLIVGGVFANLFIAIGLLFLWYRKLSSPRTPKKPSFGTVY